MAITISSRQCNQYAAGAKRAARQGPVFITDRVRPAHVLLSIEHYHHLIGQGLSIADLLSMPEGGDPELPLPHWEEPARRADLG